MLSRPQDHSAAEMIRSIEKKIHLIGTWTRDLPACSMVPQPTTLPRPSYTHIAYVNNIRIFHKDCNQTENMKITFIFMMQDVVRTY
jgi:hypothetical protein